MKRTAIHNVLVLCCLMGTMSSCATLFDGTKDFVEYKGASGRLSFFDQANRQLPSYYEFDTYDSAHINYIQLDKSDAWHIIKARLGNRVQLDTIRRRIGFGWLLPDLALLATPGGFSAVMLTYTLAPAIVDYATSAIFYFPDQKVRLDITDTSGLPNEHIFEMAAEPERNREEYRIAAHLGYFSPIHQVPIFFTAIGASIGNNLGSGLWTDLGFNTGTYMEQQLGPEKKVYNTAPITVDLGVQYYPWRYFYASGGLSYINLTFNKAFNHKEGPYGFSRNVLGFSYGLGASVRSIKLEYRRYLGFSRIDTPVGLDHAVAFGQFRMGVEIHFDLADF